FGAFGQGKNPVLSAFEKLEHENPIMASAHSGTWKTEVSREPKVITFNGRSGNKRMHPNQVVHPLDWNWHRGILSLRTENASWNPQAIELCQRDCAMRWKDPRSYLHFDGIDFH